MDERKDGVVIREGERERERERERKREREREKEGEREREKEGEREREREKEGKRKEGVRETERDALHTIKATTAVSHLLLFTQLLYTHTHTHKLDWFYRGVAITVSRWHGLLLKSNQPHWVQHKIICIIICHY